MKFDAEQVLVCPECGADVRLDADAAVCRAEHRFPVVNRIPRFVPRENYAGSFGFQWKTFSDVQIDSRTHADTSAQRFWNVTGWTPEDLDGKLVLDAGCGAGRFAQIAFRAGARLTAVDLSEAVDACAATLASDDPLVCQASIYKLPFRPESFDFVYSIGVIQHTPDPLGAIRALCRLVKPGGSIALWMYELNWKVFVGTAAFKYSLRPLISRLSRTTQMRFCSALVTAFFPLFLAARRAGVAGRLVARMLPVAAEPLVPLPLSAAQLREWMLLDTFDMYTPAHDSPQRFSVVKRILQEEGFTSIRRNAVGAIAVTAVRTT